MNKTPRAILPTGRANFDDFHPGQLVECIDDTPPNRDDIIPDMTGLTKGHVYTVRWVGLYAAEGRVFMSIRLVEIPRPALDGEVGDVPYYAHRFRPLPEERLAIFRTMLQSVTEEA